MSGFVRMLGRNATLLGGVLLAAVVVAVAVVRLPPVQRWTAARISAQLPAGVSIQRATITVLPPGIRLAQVTLHDGSTLHSVSCHARLSALLAGRLELGRVSIKGADLTLERTAGGALELSGAPTADGAAAAPPSALPALPPFGALPAITIKDANLTLIDRQAHHGPEALHFRAVRFTLASPWADTAPVVFSARLDPAGRIEGQGALRRITDTAPSADRTISMTAKATGLDAQTVIGYLAEALPGGGNAKVSGTLDGSLTLTGRLQGGIVGDATLSADDSASVMWDQVHISGPLTLAGQFAAGRDAATISNAQLTIARLSAARIAASNVGIEFGYGDGALGVTTAHATLYGGTWTQRGSVTMADPPAFNTTVRAEDVDCAALLTALTGAPPEYGCNQLSADAILHGNWTGARSVARAAEGNGSVTLSGGTIPAASVIGAIWRAVVPLVHAGKELNDVTPPTHVDHLTQSFTLQNGVLQTGDLTLVADDYTITGAGTVGMDGSLDLRTEIAMTTEGVTKLLTMASLPIPGHSATLPPIPARIDGSIDLPIIRPELTALPTDAIQALVLDARGAGQTLKGAADNGLQKVQHGLDALW